MASNTYNVHANTAASLLHYQSYTKPGTTDQSWTRFASANEEFNVASAGGHKFLIKFHANFSKEAPRHLLQERMADRGEAWLQSQQPGQGGKDAENWEKAQQQLMQNKILKTLGIRSGKGDEAKCKRCGHPKSNIPANTGHSNNTGLCQVPGCNGVTCVGGYLSSYVESRRDENKPEHDPYAGKGGQDSSCIVLNWIPLNEFQLAVGNSIIAVDPSMRCPTHPHPMDTPPRSSTSRGRSTAVLEQFAMPPTAQLTWLTALGAKWVHSKLMAGPRASPQPGSSATGTTWADVAVTPGF